MPVNTQPSIESGPAPPARSGGIRGTARTWRVNPCRAPP